MKLINNRGELLNSASSKEILEFANKLGFEYANIDHLGKVIEVRGAIEDHIKKVLELQLVDLDCIKQNKFKVVVDGVNSSGGIATFITYGCTWRNYC